MTNGSALSVNTDDPASSSGDLVQVANDLMHALREVAHDHLELATLEARLSVNRLLTMAVIAIIMAVLVVTAWLTVVAVALLGLIEIGLAPASALLLAVAANLLLAVACWIMIRRISGRLGWPSTLHALSAKGLPEARDGSVP